MSGKIIWGASAIGRVINRNRRQVYHMVDRGLIKSVRQVGNLLCANESALLAEFGGGDGAAPAASHQNEAHP
jgi:hypothetical protein